MLMKKSQSRRDRKYLRKKTIGEARSVKEKERKNPEPRGKSKSWTGKEKLHYLRY